MSDVISPKRRRSDVAEIVGSNIVGLQNVIGKTSIIFDVNFLKRDIRLVEVTEDILQSIRNKEVLKIIGPVKSSGKGVASDAVLTSNDKTFSIKKVETSNAVYILNPSSSDVYTIQSASQDYYELKSISPRIEKICEMLKLSLFDGTDTGTENQVDASCLLSYDDLRNEIQASDSEFSDILFSLGVVELSGKMRLLSKTAIAETTKQLIYTIIEKGWDINHISQNLCESSIPQTDPVLLAFTLKTLCSKTCSKSLNDGAQEPGYWALDKDTISKATAHNLFKSQSDPTAVTIKPCEIEPCDILHFSRSSSLFFSALGMRRLPTNVGCRDTRRQRPSDSLTQRNRDYHGI
jgi:Sister chromatid cohesion protein Dcc1